MSKKDFNEGVKLKLRLFEDVIKDGTEANKKVIELAEKLELNIDNLKLIVKIL